MVNADLFDGAPPSSTNLPSSGHARERRAPLVDGLHITSSTESVKDVVIRADERSPGRSMRSRRPVIGLLLDTQNLRSAGLRLGVDRINYAKVIAAVVADSPWLGVACVAKPVSRKPINGFRAYLRALGLRVSVWDSPVAAGRAKVDLDPLLVCEGTTMVTTLPLLGLCVVGGDVDYQVLAQACRYRGIKFGVAAFRGSISSTLAELSNWVLELDESFAAPLPEVA